MLDKLDISGKGKIETRIKKLEAALENFAVVFGDVNAKISQGLNFGPVSGGKGDAIPDATKDLEEQLKKMKKDVKKAVDDFWKELTKIKGPDSNVLNSIKHSLQKELGFDDKDFFNLNDIFFELEDGDIEAEEAVKKIQQAVTEIQKAKQAATQAVSTGGPHAGGSVQPSLADTITQDTNDTLAAIDYGKQQLVKAWKDYYKAVQEAQNDGIDVEIGEKSSKMAQIEESIKDMLDDFGVKAAKPSKWGIETDLDLSEYIIDGDLGFDKIEQEINSLFEQHEISFGASLAEMQSAMGDASASVAQNIAVEMDQVEDKTGGVLSSFQELVSYISQSGQKPGTFFDKLESGAQNVDDELKQILQSLNLIDSAGNINFSSINSGFTNKGGFVSGQYTMIARKITGDHGQNYLGKSQKLQEKLASAKAAGAQIGAIFDLIKDEAHGLFYEIQNTVAGKAVFSNDDGSFNLDALGATEEQIANLVHTMQVLSDNGLFIDFGGSNILYDKDKGFSIIDLGLYGGNPYTVSEQNTLQENIARFISECMSFAPEKAKEIQSVLADKMYDVAKNIDSYPTKQGSSSQQTIQSKGAVTSLGAEEAAHKQNADAIEEENAAIKEQIDLKEKAQSMSWKDFATDSSLTSAKHAEGLYTLADMEHYWKKANYDKDVDFHKLSQSEIDDILAKRGYHTDAYGNFVDAKGKTAKYGATLDELIKSSGDAYKYAKAWYSTKQDFSAKTKLENAILENEELRNIAMNKLYELYKHATHDTIDFSEFVDKTIEVYRGDKVHDNQGPAIFDSSELLAFSMQKSTANGFGGYHDENVVKTSIKPNETIGSLVTPDLYWSEYEVQVPAHKFPDHDLYLNQNHKSFEDYYQQQSEEIQNGIDKYLVKTEMNRVADLLGKDVMDVIDYISPNSSYLQQFKHGFVPESLQGAGTDYYAIQFSDMYSQADEMQKKLMAYYMSLKSMDFGSAASSKQVGATGIIGAIMNDQGGARQHLNNLTGEYQYNIFGQAPQEVLDEAEAHKKNAQAIKEEVQAKQQLSQVTGEAKLLDLGELKEQNAEVKTKIVDKSIDTSGEHFNKFFELYQHIKNIGKNIEQFPDVIKDGYSLNTNNGVVTPVSDILALVDELEQQYGENLEYVKEHLQNVFTNFDFGAKAKDLSDIADPQSVQDKFDAAYNAIDDLYMGASYGSQKEADALALEHKLQEIKHTYDTDPAKLLNGEYSDFSGSTEDYSDLISQLDAFESKYGENLSEVYNYLNSVFKHYIDAMNGLVPDLSDVATIEPADELEIELETSTIGDKYQEAIKELQTLMNTHFSQTMIDGLDEIKRNIEWVQYDVDQNPSIIDEGKYFDSSYNQLDYAALFDMVSSYEGWTGDSLEAVHAYLQEVFKKSIGEMDAFLSGQSDPFAGSATAASGDVNTEAANLNELTSEVNAVEQAVQNKTNAFEQEGATVSQVVDQEIAALTELRSLLDDIQNYLQIIFGGNNYNFGSLDLLQSNIGDSAESNVFQGIQQTIGQVLTVLQGFTGIKSDNENSLTYQEPVVDHAATTSDDLASKLVGDIATETTLSAVKSAIEQLSKSLTNEDDGKNVEQSLEVLVNSLSDSVTVLKNAANGIIQHQQAQKSDTSVAMAKIQDPMQNQMMSGIAKDTVKSLGLDAEVESLQALANGVVKIEGAFKNANGMWEGFTVKINEHNQAVDLAVKKHSAFAKMLNTSKGNEDDNPHVYDKAEVEARAQKHLEEYAAQGKMATVQFKDSGRYTITILEEIDGLTKQIFQTFDENDDKIERTTVTMSNNQKTKLENLQKKLIENGLSSGLISDSDADYNNYLTAVEDLDKMTSMYSQLDNLSDGEIAKWKQQIALVQHLGNQVGDLIKKRKLANEQKIFESDRGKKLSKFDLDYATLQKDIDIPESFTARINDARSAIENATNADSLKIAINNWEALQNEIKQTAIEQDLYFKKTKQTSSGVKPSEFDKSLASQKNAFEKYKDGVIGAAGVTDDLKNRLNELEAELGTIGDADVLKAWEQSFKSLQTDIFNAINKFKIEKKATVTEIGGKANAKFKEAGFKKDDNNLTQEQQEIADKYSSLLNQIKEYNAQVGKNQDAEISGIQQTRDELYKLIDAYKQKHNITDKTYGSKQLETFGTKYNSLMAGAADVGLTSENAAVKNLADAYQQLQAAQAAFNAGDNLQSEEGKQKVAAFLAAKQACNEYARELKNLVDAEKMLAANSVAFDPLESNFNDTAAGRRDALVNFMQSTYGASAAVKKFDDDCNQLSFTVKNGDGTITDMTATINAARTAIYATAGATKEMSSGFGLFLKEVSGKFKSILPYLTASFGWQEIWQQIRQGLTYVKEIDSALTELKKVTDETDVAYSNFLQTMSKTADNVGGTIKDLTNMAAEWARLGYSLEDAGKLAESTAILLNVSEFQDATAASEALISTMQAFQYTADDSQRVVDILNEVGNNYAVSSDGIATALQDSASALMEGGNNLEQAVALVAAANKVVQDPNSVGSALRTISLRLRGTSVEVLQEMGEETDGVIESTSKLQAKIKALSGVNILTDAGNYKDTYTILKEIGTVWEDMSDIDQAALLELMAGKNRANTLSAILSNMEDLEGAYESALNAEGSALKENEAYLDSIQGRVDIFNNALQTMWMNFVDSDVVKFVVDLGTAFIKAADSVGVLNTAISALLAAKIFSAKEGGLLSGLQLFSYTKEAGFGLNQDSLFAGIGKLFDKSKVDEFAQSVTNVGNAANGAAAGVQALNSAQMEQSVTSTGAAVQNFVDATAEQNVGTSAAGAAVGVQALDSAQDAQGASAAGAAVKNAVVSGTQTAVGTTATAAAIGVNLLNAALTMGLSLLATAVISGVMKLIDDAIHRAENLKQEVKELKDTYKEAQKTFNDNLKTLTTSSDTKTYATLQDEFAELAAGVDKYGNNISLTSDEYARYKAICEEIVGINPDIAKGYDDATQAIGNNVSVLRELIKLQRIQQQNSVKELLSSDNIESYAQEAHDTIEELVGEIADIELGMLTGVLTGGNGIGLSNILYEAFDWNNKGTKDYGDRSSNADDLAKHILEIIGMDSESIEAALSKFYNEHGYFQYSDFIKEYADIIQQNAWMLPKQVQEWAERYEDTKDELSDAKESLDDARNGFIDILLQVPFGEDAYYGMNDASKSVLTEWIKNSEMFKIDPNATPKEMREQLDANIDSIQDMIEIFADENVQAIFDEFNNIDPSSMFAFDYRTALMDIVNRFWDSIGGSENDFGLTKMDAQNLFGFDANMLKDLDDALNVIEGYFNTNKIDIDPSEAFNIKTMTQTEMEIFLGIDWNEISAENVKSVQDVWDIIRAEMAHQRDEGIGTYSSLSSTADSYDSIQAQTDEILHNGIQVTQEYKDALIELGIAEQDLKECFDENNPLIVKNASALKDLVDQSKYNTAQNVKMAKSHARLKYNDLVKELNQVLDVTGELPAMNRLAAESILSQIDAVETAIYKYTLLEDKLLGVHNAFEKFNEAKETDGLNTYGDSYVEMVQTMYDAHTKTGEYGTEAYQAAVDALINPNHDLLQGVEKGTAAYHQAVRDILMNEIVPTLTLDGDSLSIDQASMMKFVQENLDGLFTGDLSKFDLNTVLEDGTLLTLEKAAELAGMTETQVYAMLAALKDFTGADYLSMLDHSTEGEISRANQQLAELNRQKLELMKDGFDIDSTEIQELNRQIQELLGNLDALKARAADEVDDYELTTSLIEKFGEFGDLSKVAQEDLKNAFTDDEITQLMKIGIDFSADDAEEMLYKLQQYLLTLEEPTVIKVQYAIESKESEIDKLQTKIDELLIKKQEAEKVGDFVSASNIQQEIDAANLEIGKFKREIEDLQIKFGLAPDETVMEELQEIESFVINNKKFSVGFIGDSYLDTSRKLSNLANQIKKLQDTAFEIGATIVWSGTNDVNGTAHALGTAFKTGSWGAPRTERALVGELGPELLVRGSKWTTIGENGAEFTNIRKGDIIFNHKQTEDLLSKGYISGRGRSIGSAFASGTAYNNPWGGFLPVMNNNGSGSDGSLSGSKDDEFEEIFDWFEVLLEEINEQLDLMNAKLENAVGIGAKGSLIDQLLNTNHYKIYELAEGIKLYTDYAAKLLQKVPAQYREMAQNGAVEITEFLGEANEETVEAINNYREWAQKVADLNQQLEETKTEVADLAKQKFDVVVDEYDNIISILEAQRDQFDAQISLMEDRGYVAAKVYYESMIQNTRKQSGELEKQKKAMQAVLDEQVRLGNIKVGSEQWYEMIEALYDVDSSIKDCVADLEEYQNALNDIHWENFENLTNRLDYLKEETQSLIDLMDSEDMVITPETDDGWSADQVEWTEEGLASLGLYAQQMEIAEYTARQYAEAIDDLNADFAAGKYSESEYQEKLEELTSAQYDSIEAYYDAQEAIKDLQQARVDEVKKGIEKQIEAYEKLIQKKKEELDADKDLYDFEKSVTDQQKNISDIERKIAALSADNSMAAAAKRKQLEAELAEARAALEESYHDRSVADQQDALDKELENYKEEKDAEIEELEKYLEDVKTVVADSLLIIQDNASGIYDTLSSKAEEYNLTLSDSIVSPWRDGELAISDYQTTFDTAMSSTTNQLEAMKNKWQELIDKMANAAQGEINSQQEQNDRYVESTPVPTVSNDTTSKPIVVGGKINAGSALIYADSYGAGAGTQYYSSDPIYTVLQEKNGYVLVRHHSLTSGSTGWFKKSDVRGYAKGTTGTKSDELAWIDELGDELVMHADGSGRLSFLTKGTAVIPHDISENLVELGQLDPTDLLTRSTPSISMSPSVTTNNMEVSMQIAEVVHIDTVSNDTIPDLTKAIEKQMDKYMRNINNNIRKYAR